MCEVYCRCDCERTAIEGSLARAEWQVTNFGICPGSSLRGAIPNADEALTRGGKLVP